MRNEFKNKVSSLITHYSSLPFEFLYYIGYSIKKQHSLKHQKRLPHKVISIGNITVGGTGKTPATIAIAEEAKKRGFSPIILTRGYRGKAKGPCFVTPTLHNSNTPSLLYGDEPVLMAERLKDVPIVKCADRYEGGMFFLQNYEPSAMSRQPIFILDDGFQHWRLYRDLDIVLIDGIDPFGSRKMLPMGPLREPLEELKRADIFVVTKTRNESLSNELRGINPHAPVYFSEYRMLGLRDSNGTELPMETLKNKKVYAFCGIANPESFRQTVLSIAGDLKGFKIYRDHYIYTKTDMDYLKKQCNTLSCDFLVTTEKDMVKLKELNLPKNLLCIGIGFFIDKTFFDYIFDWLIENF